MGKADEIVAMPTPVIENCHAIFTAHRQQIDITGVLVIAKFQLPQRILDRTELVMQGNIVPAPIFRRGRNLLALVIVPAEHAVEAAHMSCRAVEGGGNLTQPRILGIGSLGQLRALLTYSVELAVPLLEFGHESGASP